MTDSTSDNHESGQNDRRDFLKKTGAAIVASAAAAEAGAQETPQVKFLPEEQWRDRMKAPDDGIKYGWLIDTRRCFGCHGCEVACKAENDVPLGDYIRQTIYHDHEKSNGQMARIMVPMACQHCEDAPCLKACPCGALHKGAGGSVQVDYDTCSGHSACKDACPYGAIYIDPVANQAVKCHNCTHRLEVGLEPACTVTCPSEALYFGDLNDPNSKISKMRKVIDAEENAERGVLREDKGTKPRMEFIVSDDSPMAEWEPKIPKEGQSYHNDAYSVFNWGEENGGEGK
ncbi:MAG: tetrathionate reductase subunit B [Planctomycetota bacterium]|jgi:tetrathionate reductase subunit B